MDGYSNMYGILRNFVELENLFFGENNIPLHNRRDRMSSSRRVPRNNNATNLSLVWICSRQFDRDGLLRARYKSYERRTSKIIAQNGEIFSSRHGVIYVV